MTKFFFLILVFLFSLSLNGQEGVEFFEGSFSEALKLAEDNDKLIFIDAYTTWCGPCKRMKKSVFPDKLAGDFYNQHFINMAIDMETQEGKAFNMDYPVRSYPSFLFINPAGEVVMRDVGAKSVDRFVQMGQNALKADDRSSLYTKMFDEGKRDFDFMVKYVQSLNRAEKPSTAIANKYLRNENGLTDEERAIFIFEATTECDSRLFEMMTAKKTKKLLLKLYPKAEFDQKVYNVCWTTVQKALSYDVYELLDEAKKKYKKNVSKVDELFLIEVDVLEAKDKRDASSYLKHTKKMIDKLDDEKRIGETLSSMISDFPSDQAIGKYALNRSRKSLDRDGTSLQKRYTHALMLMNVKQYKEAVEQLDIALDQANKAKEYRFAQQVMLLKKKAQSKLRVD